MSFRTQVRNLDFISAGHRSLSLRGIEFTAAAQPLNTNAGYRGLPLRGIDCNSDVSRLPFLNIPTFLKGDTGGLFLFKI